MTKRRSFYLIGLVVIIIAGLLFYIISRKEKPESAIKKEKVSENEVIKDQDSKPEDEEDGLPPFKIPCESRFKYFGEYRISMDTYNVYLSGRNFNPELSACNFGWGEFVTNVIPPDTNISVMKIHLLDLENFSIPTNHTEYGSDSIKKFVIAVYTTNTKTDKTESIFDPYKTGKYSTKYNYRSN